MKKCGRINSGGSMFDFSQDAVFLPGKIHGCDYQIYIIYQNEQANEGKGSWEIEVIDCYRILKLYEDVKGDAVAFWGLLPDLFHGEWRYCNKGMDGYEELEKAYPTADFIVGRDGDLKDELDFLVNWATNRIVREE
jgi:hypothetical protein